MQQIFRSEPEAARRRIPFRMVDSADGKTAKTGLTFAAADVKVSKSGAAEANSAGTVTEVAGGTYYYEPTAGEVDTLGYVQLRVVKSGALDFVAVVQIVEEGTRGAVATDAGNGATSFKTDLADTTNDVHKDKLCLFLTGALAGQVKRVTAFNGSTKFLTVQGGYTGTPASGDKFRLINQ